MNDIEKLTKVATEKGQLEVLIKLSKIIDDMIQDIK